MQTSECDGPDEGIDVSRVESGGGDNLSFDGVDGLGKKIKYSWEQRECAFLSARGRLPVLVFTEARGGKRIKKGLRE